MNDGRVGGGGEGVVVGGGEGAVVGRGVNAAVARNNGGDGVAHNNIAGEARGVCNNARDTGVCVVEGGSVGVFEGGGEVLVVGGREGSVVGGGVDAAVARNRGAHGVACNNAHDTGVSVVEGGVTCR